MSWKWLLAIPSSLLHRPAIAYLKQKLVVCQRDRHVPVAATFALHAKRANQSAVKIDRKTRAEPRKENETLYAELHGRHADLTRKLTSSGYL